MVAALVARVPVIDSDVLDALLSWYAASLAPMATRSHADDTTFFIELNMLACHAAKDHCAQPAIAERQRLGPFRGGLLIPKRERRRHIRGVAGLKNGKRRERGKKLAGEFWHLKIFANTAPQTSSIYLTARSADRRQAAW